MALLGLISAPVLATALGFAPPRANDAELTRPTADEGPLPRNTESDGEPSDDPWSGDASTAIEGPSQPTRSSLGPMPALRASVRTTGVVAFHGPPPTGQTDAAGGPAPEGGTDQVQPAPRVVDRSKIDEIEPPPFPLEPLQLSEALRRALNNNLDLRARVVDVRVSEAAVTTALGAYDLQIIAGTSASRNKSTPRGSAFVFATGSKTLAGYAGLRQRLPTGGSIELRMTMTRTLTDQPISFINPALGSASIASYIVAPSLTLTHPLLRGLGIKVNRAAVERARVNASQSLALEQQLAQDLVRDIVNAYWDLYFARYDLVNKQRAVLLQRDQLDRTLAQIAAGRRPPVEAKSVQQALASRENDVLLAENTLLDRSLTLRALLGQDYAEAEAIAIDPTTEPGLITPQVFDHRAEIQRAMASNPTIRQLQFALASRRIDEIEAANQRLPQLNFTGTFTPQGRAVDTSADPSSGRLPTQVGWGEAFGNFISADPRTQGLLADFTVTGALDLVWDVQTRTGRGNHQRTMAELQRAEINLARQRQNVTAAVVRAVNSIRTAGKRMEVAAISVELATENLAAEEAKFEVGRATNYDVLFRITELTNAQRDELSARVEYLKARSTLLALNGEIFPAMGLEMAAYLQR